MLGLDGKVILVTGGSRGIGAATVGLLQEMGARVAYVSRSIATPPIGFHVHADVTSSGDMERAAQTVEAELGPIYGVVANAGIARDRLFSLMSREEWDQVVDVNLNGAYHTLRPIMPRLFRRRQGSVVLVSSIVGEHGNAGQANYAASKAGLIGLGKALAHEGARYGVRTNVVAPGFIETEMLQSVSEKTKEKIRGDIPFGRFGHPEEIAWAIAFLLSPVASGYITGEVLRVNGGHHT